MGGCLFGSVLLIAPVGIEILYDDFGIIDREELLIAPVGIEIR